MRYDKNLSVQCNLELNNVVIELKKEIKDLKDKEFTSSSLEFNGEFLKISDIYNGYYNVIGWARFENTPSGGTKKTYTCLFKGKEVYCPELNKSAFIGDNGTFYLFTLVPGTTTIIESYLGQIKVNPFQ